MTQITAVAVTSFHDLIPDHAHGVTISQDSQLEDVGATFKVVVGGMSSAYGGERFA